MILNNHREFLDPADRVGTGYISTAAIAEADAVQVRVALHNGEHTAALNAWVTEENRDEFVGALRRASAAITFLVEDLEKYEFPEPPSGEDLRDYIDGLVQDLMDDDVEA